MRIDSIFCLSLPGAHMTYMSVLVKCLLQHITPSNEYMLHTGSWHGIDHQLPVKFLDYKFLSVRSNELWDEYYRENLSDNITVFRDEWRDSITPILQEGINKTQSIVILNTIETQFEKYYRWLNAIDRIPMHLFRNMKQASKYYPKLWHLLPKHVKREEFEKNINFNIANTIPHFTVPVLQTTLTELLNERYCTAVEKFLNDNDLETSLNDDILSMHRQFIEANKKNVKLAEKLIAHDFWQPRHLLDEILFKGIVNYGF